MHGGVPVVAVPPEREHARFPISVDIDQIAPIPILVPPVVRDLGAWNDERQHTPEEPHSHLLGGGDSSGVPTESRGSTVFRPSERDVSVDGGQVP
jgi:hypothetical protein